ncbi:MAG TPA: N-acetylmuramoyl-L-alanine amidase [Thermoanaerobaculia bacterium]|nr:N-acetylmuramoyl-L-alanine amidase [Thermoanaerobaculia bacterium]
MVLLVLLAVATLVLAQGIGRATVRTPNGDREVMTIQQRGETLLAADETIAAFGGRITAEGEGFRIALGAMEAIFGPDSRFAVVRDDLIEMAQEPVVIEGRAFLPSGFFRELIPRASGLDVTWDPASRLLLARPRTREVLSAQVSVVDLQGTTKIVIQFSGAAEHTITRTGTSYLIQLRNTVRAPFAEQAYDNPRVSRITFRDGEIGIHLRGAAVAGDAYELQNPFRIVLDLKEAPEGSPAYRPQLRTEPRFQQTLPGVRTIVLDPGHGGKEVGAIGPNGLMEKDATLAICRKLAAVLSSRLGLRVILTRNEDEAITLEQRTALANHYKADLFLSVHLNAAVMKGARGAETYFLSVEASDELARSAAERENLTPSGSRSRAGSDLNLILWELAQQEYLKESSRFAEIVQEEMNRALGIENRGVKQAPFKVLIGATMPAALVEVGFITNPDEEAKLLDEGFQGTIASTLASAIERYKTEYDVRMGVGGARVAAPAPAGAGDPAAAEPERTSGR